jgi:hypothetical protein
MENERLTRIAKSIVGRSQMVKTCVVHDEGLCDLHIEESVFAQDEYTYQNLMDDIEGFLYDVDRELGYVTALDKEVVTCDKNKIHVCTGSDADLMCFSYDCSIYMSDEGMERIRDSEWRIKE